MASSLSLPHTLNAAAHIAVVETLKEAMGVNKHIAEAMLSARSDTPTIDPSDAEHLVHLTFDKSLEILLGIVGQNPKSILFEIQIEKDGRVIIVDGDVNYRVASGNMKDDFRSDIKKAITPVLEKFFQENRIPRSSDLSKLVQKSLSLQFSNILLDSRLQYGPDVVIKCIRK